MASVEGAQGSFLIYVPALEGMLSMGSGGTSTGPTNNADIYYLTNDCTGEPLLFNPTAGFGNYVYCTQPGSNQRCAVPLGQPAEILMAGSYHNVGSFYISQDRSDPFFRARDVTADLPFTFPVPAPLRVVTSP